MRGKKTDIKTKAKVVELKTINPELSSYDISKMLEGTAWEISADSVQDILKELPQLTASDTKGEKIISKMDEIITEIVDITRLALKPIKGKVEEGTLSVSDLKSLNDIAKNNFDRKQLLTGKPTDIRKHEGLSNLSDSELLGLAGLSTKMM